MLMQQSYAEHCTVPKMTLSGQHCSEAAVCNDTTGTIADFFAHKNVFITGGTGFLGTVLIEAILGASPNVGTIYVLVRDKYGSNANTRIQRMLSKPVSRTFIIHIIYTTNTKSLTLNFRLDL